MKRGRMTRLARLTVAWRLRVIAPTALCLRFLMLALRSIAATTLARARS